MQKKIGRAIAILIIAGINYFFFQKDGKSTSSSTQKPDQSRSSILKNIKITRHAKCRMGCRKINESEIMEVIEQGSINKRKTNPNSKPCPTTAYEHRTYHDKQKTRVIVGHCPGIHKIVTVIDLENEYQCQCH